VDENENGDNGNWPGCPQCTLETGKPVSCLRRIDRRSVELRCPRCGRVFQYTASVPVCEPAEDGELPAFVVEMLERRGLT
jgi:hypothetical protein